MKGSGKVSAQASTMDKNYSQMLSGSIPRMISKLAVPSMISMMITSIYNAADTYFVSTLGTSASAAVGVVLLIMTIIQAFGFTFGMGANSNISRLLGRKDYRKANAIASSALASCMLFCLAFVILAFLIMQPMLTFFGATSSILPYAESYASLILLGGPLIGGAFVLNNLLRSQGLNAMSMIGLAIGGFLNIVLDPIFIFVFDMGIAGAAVATVISQTISFLVLFYIIQKKSVLNLQFQRISKRLSTYIEIVKIGLPSFFRQAMASMAIILLNNQAAVYGDAAVAAFAILGRINQIFYAFVIGFGQGFQPVAGYNYGGGKYKRVRQAYYFTFVAMLVILIIAAIIMFSFSEEMIRFFRDDPKVVAIGAKSLKYFAIAFVTQPALTASNMMLQSTGQARSATFTAMLRQGLYFLPLIFLLPHLWQLEGLMLVQPVADVLSALTTLPFALVFLNRLKKMEAHQVEHLT